MSRNRQAAVYGLGTFGLLLAALLLILLGAEGPLGGLAILVLGLLSGYLGRRAIQLVYKR